MKVHAPTVTSQPVFGAAPSGDHANYGLFYILKAIFR